MLLVSEAAPGKVKMTFSLDLSEALDLMRKLVPPPLGRCGGKARRRRFLKRVPAMMAHRMKLVVT